MGYAQTDRDVQALLNTTLYSNEDINSEDQDYSLNITIIIDPSRAPLPHYKAHEYHNLKAESHGFFSCTTLRGRSLIKL